VPIPARALYAGDLDPDPFVQFRRWYADAEEHGQLQPDAMVVATSTIDGHPSARMVLLRGVDDRGFWFFTNFESR
jgi:pyridoxamine 5'-phosphate oxidase